MKPVAHEGGIPNLKHHGVCCQTVCLDSLEPWRGPLQRRSFSGANCSYQAVLPSRPRQVSCSKPLGWSRGLGALLATEPLVGCQQDQILGLGLRQTVRDRTTGRTSFVKPTGGSNFFASSKLEAARSSEVLHARGVPQQETLHAVSMRDATRR